MEIEANLGLNYSSFSTNIYFYKLEEIWDLKIFPNASAGHWKRCGGPHVARGPLFARPSVVHD